MNNSVFQTKNFDFGIKFRIIQLHLSFQHLTADSNAPALLDEPALIAAGCSKFLAM
jgi:hypothetical protein